MDESRDNPLGLNPRNVSLNEDFEMYEGLLTRLQTYFLTFTDIDLDEIKLNSGTNNFFIHYR